MKFESKAVEEPVSGSEPVLRGDYGRRETRRPRLLSRGGMGVALACALAMSSVPSGAQALLQHTVGPGETLSGIAERYGLPLGDIVALNSIADEDRILAGQVLRLEGEAETPASASSSYTVRAGDTLSQIAGRLGISQSTLVAANGLTDADHIVIGQSLQIGVTATGSAAPSAQAGHQVVSGEQAGHRVVSGETLSAIARAYGVTVAAFAESNAISDVNHIVEGTVLVVPGRSAATRPEVRELLFSAAAEFGIDPPLVLAVAWQESGWNQTLVSRAGAVGVMQVIPPTGDWAASELIGGAYNWRVDARDNARIGAAVLRNLLDATGWDVRLAVAGYYQGLGNIRRGGLSGDTEQYVENVLALAERFD